MILWEACLLLLLSILHGYDCGYVEHGCIIGALMFVCTLSTALWGGFLYFFFSTVIALRGSSYRLGETML